MKLNNAAPEAVSPVDRSKIEHLDLPQRIAKDELSVKRFYGFLDRAARIAAKTEVIHFIITVHPETLGVVASYLDAIGARQGDHHIIHDWRDHKELRVKLEKEDEESMRRYQQAMRQPLEPQIADLLTQALSSLGREF